MKMIKKIILLVGMPGSGKSIVADTAKNIGLFVLYMGDVIREETMKMNLPLEAKSYYFILKNIREKYGSDIIAKKTFKKINNEVEIVCIDGVRSPEEVSFFKTVSQEIVVLGIISSFSTRFKRLISRNRNGDPKIYDEMLIRDKIELSLGIGNIIATADHYLLNDGIPIYELEEISKKFLSTISKL